MMSNTPHNKSVPEGFCPLMSATSILGSQQSEQHKIIKKSFVLLWRKSTGATEVPFLLGTVFHQSSLRDKDVFSGVSVEQQKAKGVSS